MMQTILWSQIYLVAQALHKHASQLNNIMDPPRCASSAFSHAPPPVLIENRPFYHTRVTLKNILREREREREREMSNEERLLI